MALVGLHSTGLTGRHIRWGAQRELSAATVAQAATDRREATAAVSQRSFGEGRDGYGHCRREELQRLVEEIDLDLQLQCSADTHRWEHLSAEYGSGRSMGWAHVRASATERKGFAQTLLPTCTAWAQKGEHTAHTRWPAWACQRCRPCGSIGARGAAERCWAAMQCRWHSA